MTVNARVIGIGQRAAGDDGVGLHILERLKQSPPPGVQLHQLTDATQLFPLLENVKRVILVDAVLGEPGEASADTGCAKVLCLRPEQLSEVALSSVSSHDVSVAQALELARTLSPGGCQDVRIVGVQIDTPRAYTQELSPAVAAAIEPSIACILEQLED